MKNRMDTNLTPLQFGVHTNWEPFCYLSVLTQIWPVVLQKREAFPILEFGVLMSLVILWHYGGGERAAGHFLEAFEWISTAFKLRTFPQSQEDKNAENGKMLPEQMITVDLHCLADNYCNSALCWFCTLSFSCLLLSLPLSPPRAVHTRSAACSSAFIGAGVNCKCRELF